MSDGDRTLSDAERAALKEHTAELRRQAVGADGESDVLAAIEAMPEQERAVALGFHALVRETAPDLAPRTWYGMPAYARPGRRGKVVCFFTGAAKGDARYHEVGLTDAARLDRDVLWPTSYAVVGWDDAVEQELHDLLARAVG